MNLQNWVKYGLMIFLVVFTSVLTVAQDETETHLIGLWETCETPDNLPEIVSLGAIYSLSGPLIESGRQQSNGTLLAIEEINASGYLGDSTTAEVYIENSSGDVDTALGAADRLINGLEVVALLGPTLSTEAVVIFPFAQVSKVPILGVNTGAPGLTQGRDFVFRYNLPEVLILPEVVQKTVRVFDAKRVALIYNPSDPFASRAHRIFTSDLVKTNVSIVANIETSSIRDFPDAVATLVEAQPDIVFAATGVLEAIELVLSLRENGYDGPIVGNDAFNSPLLTASGNNDTDGVITGTTWHPDYDNVMNNDFVIAYRTKFRQIPDTNAVHAYVGAWMLATAIRCANSTEPEAIRDTMATLEMDSPFGLLRFNSEREVLHPAIVQVVQNGQFVVLEAE